MKKHILSKTTILALTFIMFAATSASAQRFVHHPRPHHRHCHYTEDVADNKCKPIERVRLYIDWQFNSTISNSHVNNASGWGMAFEGGYLVTPRFFLGAFLTYHTNNEYIPRKTYFGHNSALTTDKINSTFQLPLGVSGRYYFTDSGSFYPYVGVKAGAAYLYNEEVLNTVTYYDNNWGFYVSPEIGVDINPFRSKRFGFHIAAYYNYSTNENLISMPEEKGLHNAGFRVGINF